MVRAQDAEFDTPEFLARLRAGDDAAYRRLIRRYHASLVGIAQGVIGSQAQAEEVVQDTWLAVFRNINRFEGRSSLAGWLFTIARNRARTRIASEGRTVALPGLDGVERAVDASEFRPDGHWIELPALWDVLDPERVIGGRQLWELVQAAIETLPAAQKATIMLRDIEGRASEEVCTLLGVSAENQRVLLHRARGKVRAAIDVAMGNASPVAAVRVAKPGAKDVFMAFVAWLLGHRHLGYPRYSIFAAFTAL
jgi:RNA polymerase sigma-70 factor (ECF subfamily)